MRASVLFGAYVVFTLISGAAQDMLYTSYKFNETDAMSLVQSLVLFIMGAISHLFRESGVSKHCQPIVPTKQNNLTPAQSDRKTCSRVPAHVQLALGVSIAGNVLLTNYATEYLSFPIQVVFKSSKLLVAMLVRSVVFSKPNKRIDYYCAIMLSLGLIGFMWPSSSHAPADNEGDMDPSTKFVVGVLCVLGSLIAEAVMLNVQEFYLFQQYEVSTEWVMMYGYLYSTASQLILLALVGTLGRTVDLLLNLDAEICALTFAFPVFMWIGVTFLLFLVKDHGAVVASAANVVRKVIAVAFSFIYFGREVTVPLAVGGFLVFGSIVWRSFCDGGGHGHSHAASSSENAASAPRLTIDSKRGGSGRSDDGEDSSPLRYGGTPWPGLVSKQQFGEAKDENPAPVPAPFPVPSIKQTALFVVDEDVDGEKDSSGDDEQEPLTGGDGKRAIHRAASRSNAIRL